MCEGDGDELEENSTSGILKNYQRMIVMFWPSTRPQKMLFLGDAPEGSDTFQWPVIERDRVGWLRLIIWDKVKVPLCHYSDAPEESPTYSANWALAARVFPFSRNAVGIFNNLSQLESRFARLTSLQICSRYIQQPQLTGPHVVGVLPLCRNAIGKFNNLSQLNILLHES